MAKIDWQFANIRLSLEQRQEFVLWCDDTTEDFTETLTVVIQAGYKLSVRFDSERDIWMATLTATPDCLDNAKSSLTARHDTYEHSVLLVMYKHLVIAGGGEWSDYIGREEWG